MMVLIIPSSRKKEASVQTFLCSPPDVTVNWSPGFIPRISFESSVLANRFGLSAIADTHLHDSNLFVNRFLQIFSLFF